MAAETNGNGGERVSYTTKELLTRIEDKIDRLDTKLDVGSDQINDLSRRVISLESETKLYVRPSDLDRHSEEQMAKFISQYGLTPDQFQRAVIGFFQNAEDKSVQHHAQLEMPWFGRMSVVFSVLLSALALIITFLYYTGAFHK